jgi:SAM-dependent methyltransferase
VSADPRAYTNLARVYEAAGWGRFSEGLAESVLGLAERLGLPKGGHIVDLACSVGIACVRFAGVGYRVTGIDFAEEMLAQTQDKAAQAGVTVNWVAAEMRGWIRSHCWMRRPRIRRRPGPGRRAYWPSPARVGAGITSRSRVSRNDRGGWRFLRAPRSLGMTGEWGLDKGGGS